MNEFLKHFDAFIDHALTEQEQVKVVEQLRKGQNQDKVSEKDAVKVMQWAIRAKLDTLLLSLVLRGYVNLTIKKGEVSFSPCEEIKASQDQWDYLLRDIQKGGGGG